MKKHKHLQWISLLFGFLFIFHIAYPVTAEAAGALRTVLAEIRAEQDAADKIPLSKFVPDAKQACRTSRRVRYGIYDCLSQRRWDKDGIFACSARAI